MLLPTAAALLLASAAPALAGNLVQVRVGNHPTYTRVVFELDSPTGYRIERRAAGESENTVVVTLQAASRVRQIQSKSAGVETVAVEPVDGQAVARIVTRKPGLPIKEMILTNPPRVVLDLMLPASARTAAAARSTSKPKPAAAPVAEAPAPTEEPAAATPPAPLVVADNQPDAAELAPEPPVAPAPAPRAVPPEPTPAPVAVTPPSTADAMADEGESVDVAEPVTAPDEELAAAEADVEALEAEADAVAEAEAEAADAVAQAEVDAADAEAERMAAKVAELEAERAAEAELEAQLWAQQQEQRQPSPPGAMAQTPPPGAAVVPALQEPAAADDGSGALPLPDLDPITLGAIAGVALALLVVIVAVLRRRRALPNDMDVTAFAAADAEAAGEDQPVASGGFAMDAPSSAMEDPAEDFESGRAHATDDENKPIESARAPLSGAGLFDDTPTAKDATTMQDQDMSMTQGASDAPTHLGVGSGLAGMAGDSNVASLVQELERRMTLMEQRLEEANEARERLERQVSAQSEELRVQRAAIARTQRALRGLNRSEEDQATEPALRDPADPAGRQ